MRKWIVLVLVVIMVLVVIFWKNNDKQPDGNVIDGQVRAGINAKAFSRAILTPANWHHWWPGDVGNGQLPVFSFKGNKYTIIQKKLTSLAIAITNEKDTAITELVTVAAKPNTVEVVWTSAGPLVAPTAGSRNTGKWIKKTNKDIEAILQKMTAYYRQAENLYGRNIREEPVKDSAFISTSVTLPESPSPEKVYGLVTKLNRFAVQNGARTTGYPMLNINQLGGQIYLVRVAYPVDKKLPSDGDIQYRQMPDGGHVLVTDVQGGPAQIERAFSDMKLWLEDHGRLAPATPFQALVTNRSAQKDTTKWKTRVYWPVM